MEVKIVSSTDLINFAATVAKELVTFRDLLMEDMKELSAEIDRLKKIETVLLLKCKEAHSVTRVPQSDPLKTFNGNLLSKSDKLEKALEKWQEFLETHSIEEHTTTSIPLLPQGYSVREKIKRAVLATTFNNLIALLVAALSALLAAMIIHMAMS